MAPDQDQTTDQKKTEPEFDPFEWMSNIRAGRGASEARVEEAVYATSLDEIATKYWLKAASEDDPIGFEKFSALLKQEREQTAEETKAEERRKTFEAEQEKLNEEEQAKKMAALQDEATVARHEAELDTFLAEGGISKARQLADVLSSRESSPSEALAAWDAASDVEREIVTTQFGVGVIDFDPDEVLGTGGAS
jgi:hypothetical protein